MADEVTGSEAVQEAEITPDVRETAIEARDVSDLDFEMEPLFDDETVSESELKGEEPEAQEDKPADSEPKAKEKPEKPPEDKEAKADEKEQAHDKKGDEAEDKKDGKPPEGYVPQEALREARYELRTVKQQLSDLQAENESLAAQINKAAPPKVSPEAEKWKDFKVLTDEEFDELVDEDPDAALKYQYKLKQYERYEDTQRNIKLNQRRAIQAQERVITNAAQRIAETIPGIYDEGSEVVVELAKFAQESGEFNDLYLEALTNPATVIRPKGSDKAYLLGEGAYSVLKIISDLKASKTAANPETIKSQLKSEIEAEIRADERQKVTAEITAKLKTGKGDYRSISDGPGAQENPGDVKKIYTEEDFFHMTPEEQERVLMGA